jgi:hypothetical protein
MGKLRLVCKTVRTADTPGRTLSAISQGRLVSAEQRFFLSVAIGWTHTVSRMAQGPGKAVGVPVAFAAEKDF